MALLSTLGIMPRALQALALPDTTELRLQTVLQIDDHIREMLLKRDTSLEITRYAQKNQGMKLLFDDVVDKMCAGETTLTEVFRVASEDEE